MDHLLFTSGVSGHYQPHQMLSVDNVLHPWALLDSGMDVGVEEISAVAKIAKERGATVVGIIRVLFVERTKIEEIRKYADTVIVLDSSRLLERADLIDQIVAEAIKRLAEGITVDLSPIINFADIRDVLRRGGIAVMFFGEGKGEDVVKNSLSHPSFDVDYNGNN